LSLLQRPGTRPRERPQPGILAPGQTSVQVHLLLLSTIRMSPSEAHGKLSRSNFFSGSAQRQLTPTRFVTCPDNREGVGNIRL
jgi:hypothetical protein